MDRDYLLRRHNEELARAQAAASSAARRAHAELAAMFKQAAEHTQPIILQVQQ